MGQHDGIHSSPRPASSAGLPSASLLDKLQKAVAGLARAEPLLMQVYTSRLGGRHEEGVSAFASRHTETLRVTRRSLEDSLDTLRAAQEASVAINREDVLIQEALRQHDRAVKLCVAAEEESREERRCIASLEKELGELEEIVARNQALREEDKRHNTARRAALHVRRSAAEAGLIALRAEEAEVRQLVADAAQRNEETIVGIKRIQKEHDAAVAENRKAQHVLGDLPSAEAYKMIKQRERDAADEALARAEREIEAEMARLDSALAAQYETFRAALLELRDDAQQLSSHLEQAKSESEGALASQAQGWGRVVEELDRRTMGEIRGFDDLRQQKAHALTREANALGQRTVEDAAAADQQIQVQVQEVRTKGQQQARIQKTVFEQEIHRQQQAVRCAKAAADRAEHLSAITREKYRAHAVKTKAFMKSLDHKRQMQLVNTWNKI